MLSVQLYITALEKKNQQCKIKYLNLGTGDQGGGSQLRPFVRSFVSALATA
jgi:hypothetical protein